jgi:peptidoglycan/xylan/chitin deacetylase (PgdA/CDA1 family)
MRHRPIAALFRRYCVWPLTLRTTRRYPRVLTYHRFSIAPDERKLDVAVFRRQLAVIRDEFQPTTLSELISMDAWRRPHDPALAVITVDDGYADFYEVAWPALREAGIPATLFVTVDFIEGQWMWPDVLEYLLFSAKSGTYLAPTCLGDLNLVLTTATERRAAWDDIATQLIDQNEARPQVISALQAALDAPLPDRPTPPYAAMTWEQLREVSAAGIEIGSHSMSHAFVAGLSPECRRRELTESKRILQDKLGTPVQCFAYPNGAPADAPHFLRNEVKAASYRAAAVCFPPSGGVPDRFGIERWPISDDHNHFLNVMHGASLLRRRIRSLRVSTRTPASSPADG